MEKPVKSGIDAATVAGMEQMLTTYIENNPDLKAEEFTPDEIHAAAVLASESPSKDDDEALARKALEARLQVRRVAGAVPVINERSEVLGTATFQQDKDAMLRQDRETRDQR